MDTKKLRQKILDLAIHGKLVPQDPNDEPASVLLERIRAEKERLIKEGKIKQSKKSAKSSDTPHYENEVPFEVPEGWVCCQVSDIFELNPKNDIPDDTQSGFIPMACVDDGFGYSHTFETKVWKEIRKGYSHFQNGDIGIAKISPCFENRKSTIFYDLPNGIGAGTTELTVLRGHCVNTEFYLYLFQSEWYIFEGTKEFKGVVGQQRVNKEIFTTLLIPLPPIEEQNRIVTEIKKWFTLIDTLKSAKEDLQASITQAKSKILDLAIHGKLVPQDPNDEPAIELLKRINPKLTPCDNAHYENVPDSWCIVPLGNICGLNEGKPISDKEYPYIDVKGLRTGNYVSKQSGKYIPVGTTLILVDGENSGEVFHTPVEGYQGSTMKVLNIFSEMNAQYVLYFVKLYQKALRENKVGSAIPHLNKKMFRELIIPIPTKEEQERIVGAIQQYYRILDNISANL